MAKFRLHWASVLGAILWAGLPANTPLSSQAPGEAEVYDPAGRLVAEALDLDGDGHQEARRHYLYGPDGQLASVFDVAP